MTLDQAWAKYGSRAKSGPLKHFCPARGVVNLTQTSYFSCKRSTFNFEFLFVIRNFLKLPTD